MVHHPTKNESPSPFMVHTESHMIWLPATFLTDFFSVSLPHSLFACHAHFLVLEHTKLVPPQSFGCYILFVWDTLLQLAVWFASMILQVTSSERYSLIPHQVFMLTTLSLYFFFFFCSEFCHTLKWNSHGFTCVLHPDPPSQHRLYPLPLGLPSAPGPSACLMHPTWAGDLFHPR